MISRGLRDVTLNAPNFKTLQTILMGRRLYQPANLKLPADQYLELNRRFAEGYIKLIGTGDTKLLALRTKIDAYIKALKLYGIEDRQVFQNCFCLICRL
jgi:glycerol-3-phosphate O-acyltransferase/dihydroxyacetone phosphate acyltransferase